MSLQEYALRSKAPFLKLNRTSFMKCLCEIPAKKPERQKNVDLRCRKRYNLSCESTKAVLSALFSICFGVTFFRIPDIMLRERF